MSPTFNRSIKARPQAKNETHAKNKSKRTIKSMIKRPSSFDTFTKYVHNFMSKHGDWRRKVLLSFFKPVYGSVRGGTSLALLL